MNWKEKFDKQFANNFGQWRCNSNLDVLVDINDIKDFISNLLEEQRKEAYEKGYDQWFMEAQEIKKGIKKDLATDINVARKNLINQILSEAPEDRKPVQIDDEAFTFTDDTEFNKCNQQWRELLTKHLI